jgi:hypothetical protein
MGQRQLPCLGRALYIEKKPSLDNAIDAILQNIIWTELKDSTVVSNLQLHIGFQLC